MKQVCPVEHGLRLRRQLRVRDLDRRFGERDVRWIDEQLPRNEHVLRVFELRHRRVRLRQQNLVQDGVAVVERVEESIGRGIVPPELPVELSWQIGGLVRHGPLRSGGERQQADSSAEYRGREEEAFEDWRHESAPWHEAANGEYARDTEGDEPGGIRTGQLLPHSAV